MSPTLYPQSPTAPHLTKVHGFFGFSLVYSSIPFSSSPATAEAGLRLGKDFTFYGSLNWEINMIWRQTSMLFYLSILYLLNFITLQGHRICYGTEMSKHHVTMQTEASWAHFPFTERKHDYISSYACWNVYNVTK